MISFSVVPCNETELSIRKCELVIQTTEYFPLGRKKGDEMACEDTFSEKLSPTETKTASK